MKLRRYPKIYFKDADGEKHFIRIINWYGNVLEFIYDENGDIVLTKKN